MRPCGSKPARTHRRAVKIVLTILASVLSFATPQGVPASSTVAHSRAADTTQPDGTLSGWSVQPTPLHVSPFPATAFYTAYMRVMDVSCASAVTCEAVGTTDSRGSTRVIMGTRDGGVSWSVQYRAVATPLRAVSCRGLHMCVAVGGSVQISGDGGQSWQQVGTGSVRLSYVSCPSVRVCYGVGSDQEQPARFVFATTDGGRTWRSLLAPHALSGGVSSMTCPAVRVCYIMGGGASMASGPASIVTTDGGQTWRIGQPGAPLPEAISCPSPITCYIVGVNHGVTSVAKTTDGGKTWSQADLTSLLFHHAGIENFAGPQNSSVAALACPTTLICYLSGSWMRGAQGGGNMVVTLDGGQNWTAEPLPPGVNLGPISCPDVAACYAGAADGSIVATTSGGIFIPPHLLLHRSTVAAGDRVGVEGWGYPAGVTIGFALAHAVGKASTPTFYSFPTAAHSDSAGYLTTTLTMPRALPAGAYEVYASSGHYPYTALGAPAFVDVAPATSCARGWRVVASDTSSDVTVGQVSSAANPCHVEATIQNRLNVWYGVALSGQDTRAGTDVTSDSMLFNNLCLHPLHGIPALCLIGPEETQTLSLFFSGQGQSISLALNVNDYRDLTPVGLNVIELASHLLGNGEIKAESVAKVVKQGFHVLHVDEAERVVRLAEKGPAYYNAVHQELGRVHKWARVMWDVYELQKAPDAAEAFLDAKETVADLAEALEDKETAQAMADMLQTATGLDIKGSALQKVASKVSGAATIVEVGELAAEFAYIDGEEAFAPQASAPTIMFQTVAGRQ